MSPRFGYVTNGMCGHRLGDALTLISEAGYDGVALTLDHHHLDPFAADLPTLLARVRRATARLGLAVVVETGARFLLDPRRKHEPTLMADDGEGGERRVDLLLRAIDIAADLDAEVTSFWSGLAPAGADAREAWGRLVARCETVLRRAEARGMTLGVEPEPGMTIARIADAEALRADLGDHPLLGITLDIGHCRCLEPEPIETCIRRVAPHLVNVHIEDMRRGVHEHLDFGDGEIDFASALQALDGVGYQGLISVELSRHSHVAHQTVPRSLVFLRREHARVSAS